jgi:hypothetical protein
VQPVGLGGRGAGRLTEPSELLGDRGQLRVRLAPSGQGVLDVLGTGGFRSTGAAELSGQPGHPGF